MKKKKSMVLGVVILFGLVIMSSSVWAANGGIVLTISKTATLQKWDNSFMTPTVGTNLEFFAGGAPAPNSSNGVLAMDNNNDLGTTVAYDYSDADGKSPRITGGAVVMRIWDGPKNTEGSHYGVNSNYDASSGPPAAQWIVAPFKANYFASKPSNAPTISGVTESNQRIGETRDVVLNLSVSFNYNEDTSNGKIPATGYVMKFWKTGETEPGDAVDGKRVFALSGTSFGLPDKDALNTDKPFGSGTYSFRVKAVNWFGDGPWSTIRPWTTLSGTGGGGSYTFTLAPSDTKLVVNTVFLPSLGSLVNASDLAAKVNNAPEVSGAKVARAVCWWDKSTGQPVVALFDDAGLVAGSKDFPLTANECYQVYTTTAVTITLP